MRPRKLPGPPRDPTYIWLESNRAAWSGYPTYGPLDDAEAQRRFIDLLLKGMPFPYRTALARIEYSIDTLRTAHRKDYARKVTDLA